MRSQRFGRLPEFCRGGDRSERGRDDRFRDPALEIEDTGIVELSSAAAARSLAPISCSCAGARHAQETFKAPPVALKPPPLPIEAPALPLQTPSVSLPPHGKD
jgi:hypothetical protein